MFLQSITLQGFKSFADRTTLELEPGITVVVGPNGSGKSNVVDALTWVLGSHSPKSLRGQAMSDVVFAGAPGRPALGRASVEIRIDNRDGVLPIDYAEVAVSRAMYTSGESEYAINGTQCRLLDVAELLSDTGLGREHHTIVGQGRLDDILQARPEERRAFVEEAAGILKHRRRKERALRKLDQMGEHVERLTDLLGELTRQLRPLERQAQAAARHADLVARRRQLRVARALRSLDGLAQRRDDLAAAESAREAEASAIRGQIDAAHAEIEQLIARLAESEPRVRRAAAAHVRLTSVAERLRGLVGRVGERRQGLFDAVEELPAGRNPQELRSQAAAEEERAAQLRDDVAAAGRVLSARSSDRLAAERARAQHAAAVEQAARRRAAAREERLRREGRIRALRSALEQAGGEESRLAVQVEALVDRADGLRRDVERARSEIQDLDAAAPRLAERLAEADTRLRHRSDVVDDLSTAERELERERASLRARADALRATVASGAGVEAVRAAAASGQLDGVVGPLAESLQVAEGMGAAVAEGLGTLGAALLAVDAESATAGLLHAVDARAGRVVLAVPVVVAPDARPERDAAVAAAGGRRLIEAVDADGPAGTVVAWALRDVYAVDDLHVAARLTAEHPECRFVTPSGASAGAGAWTGGGAGEGAAVMALAGADEAERRLASTDEELAMVHRQLSEADDEVMRCRNEVDAATVLLQESDGRITAAAERLERLEGELHRAERELSERRSQVGELHARMAAQRAQLDELAAADPVPEPEASSRVGDPHSGAGPDPGPGPDPGSDQVAEALDAELADAREAEVQARLDVRSAEAARDDAVRAAQRLRTEGDEGARRLAERAARREARLEALARCDVLAEAVGRAASRAVSARDAAQQQHSAVESRQSALRAQLDAVRARLADHEQIAADVTAARHQLAVTRAELDAELGQVVTTLAEATSGADPDALLAAARADAAAGDADAVLVGGPERDAELAQEETALDTQLRRIGEVNHLARAELERLRERHGFLTEQVRDLESSRRDLLEVVAAVDQRIREVFADAFADVAQAFEEIFPRLFPGGEGRLLLTEPDDLLSAGIEVEARPAGKRVTRLSLLSGGERSLTALAVVFAIFAARPSPFYVLDEVEAALDDVNLQRFLEVVADFRKASQLIVVTHQQQTMEIADVLYGITMRSSGVSTVVGQRADRLVGRHSRSRVG